MRIFSAIVLIGVVLLAIGIITVSMTTTGDVDVKWNGDKAEEAADQLYQAGEDTVEKIQKGLTPGDEDETSTDGTSTDGTGTGENAATGNNQPSP